VKKFLIIQTAFLGDVVLATALAEKLHAFYPDAAIDFLVRKGNEGVFDNHPYIRKVWAWDKKKQKYKGLLNLMWLLRKERYDFAINLQRFATTGFLTVFSGAKVKIGFSKNPLSRFFTFRFAHQVSQSDGTEFRHETERNQQLIADITDSALAKPKLYPTGEDYKKVESYLQQGPYITIAPASVWFTKQYPEDKWVEFINEVSNGRVYLLGGPGDKELCERIKSATSKENVHILAGELSYLQTCALMQSAGMNYTNDSAPLHFASAMDAPVTAVYCSTIPAFGFGPLSSESHIVQLEEPLYCRPCGLHGYRQCPEGHFKCAISIKTSQLVANLPATRN
jgi:heptosyltransferase-2